MSEAVSETILARRPSAEPRSQDESMTDYARAGFESSDTTDESTTDRTLDLDSVHPVEVDGGDVVFVDAFTRTDDGNALRFDGDQPVATAAVYSEIKLRNALAEAGYEHEHIEFALDHRLNGEQALAAARVAESQTHGHEAELVADGGRPTCDECGATTTGPDEHACEITHERDCSHTRGVVDPYPDEEEVVDTPL